MALHATLLLQVEPDAFRKRFQPATGVTVPAGREALAGADGTPFAMSVLHDAVAVWTGVPFDTEDDALGTMAVSLLGPALDDHGDPRGLYVFPDVASPRSADYAGAVEELGELGMWVGLPGRAKRSRAVVSQGDTDLAAQLRALGSTVPPEAAARMQDMLEGADPAMLDAARAQFEQMAAEPGGMDAMGEQIAAMMGGAPGGGSESGGMGGADMGAMLRQAQAQIAEMQKNDPAGYAALEQHALQMLSGLTAGRKK